MEGQGEPPGVAPMGPITEQDVQRALTQDEIIDVTTPSPATKTLGTSGQAEPCSDEGGGSDNETMSSQSEPPVFDEDKAEPLSFTEMYEYLRSEMRDMTLQQAKEVDSAMEYVQDLFQEVFSSRPIDPLPPDRSHYPDLMDEEMDKLIQLFLTDIKDERANARKWRSKLHDITRAIYKSRRSLSDTLEAIEQAAQAKPGQATNPWLQQLPITRSDTIEDVEMTDTTTSSSFRFFRSSYTQEEIGDLRRTCETRYDFPSRLRQPTDLEWKVVQGILEGTILCTTKLPDFLKRVCTNAALRLVQNTIKAQVEGDLMLMLSPDFKVFPEFQSRQRLTNEFFLGIKNSGNNPAKVASMLHEAKQICYDQGRHIVHIIFWTREMAAKWSKEFSTLSFRNKHFPLRNAHQNEAPLVDEPNQRSTQIWARQVGADGIRNERQHDRYHIRLLNTSRFLDESAIDSFIQVNFRGVYTTWQEPCYGNRALQTDTWEIIFRSPHCPQFLEGIRFINWAGTKCLVHHVSKNRASPCLSCGKTLRACSR